MAFRYNPQMAYPCLPPGNYRAVLTDVNETSSQRGLPMLALDLEVQHDDHRRPLHAWIANPPSLYLLRELAAAVDEATAIDAGNFDAKQYIGCEILVELRVIQTDLFGEQNGVAHYHRADPGEPVKRVRIRQSKPEAHETGAAHVPIAEADIPF